MYERKGFGFGKGLLCVLLGLILGVVIAAAAVFLVLMVGTDTVLDYMGIENTDEETGENVYVNTEEAGNLWQLISGIYALTSSDEVTLGDVDSLLPVTGSFVDEIVDAIDCVLDGDFEAFAGMTREEFKAELMAAPLDGIEQFIADTLSYPTLQEMFHSDIYVTDGLKAATSYEAAYLYYVMDGNGNFSLAEESGEKGKLTAAEFASGTYYTYGEMKGSWKLILGELKEEDGRRFYDEKAFSLNDLSSLVDNVTGNMGAATMDELSAAGMLDASDESLGIVITSGEYSGKTIGSLTTGELIDLLVSLLQAQ